MACTVQYVPLPDWFSAGADSTTDCPAAVSVSYSVRMLISAHPSSFTWTMLAARAEEVRSVVSRNEACIFRTNLGCEAKKKKKKKREKREKENPLQR